MSAWILANANDLRLGVFLGMLVLMGLWEAVAPARMRVLPRLYRWTNNLLLVVLNASLLRLIFPVLAVGMAATAVEQGWGLFNWLKLTGWLEIVIAIILMDLAIWAQHVIFHRVPMLWRLHRMHHTDVDFDVTTGLRFHPIEIVLSMAIKLGVVAALGADPVAVILFEVLLNGSAMFNHANLRLPPALESAARLVIVTPDFHRVHHSVHREEHDRNFGFFLTWWDYLFQTYRSQPMEGHEGMKIGQERFRAKLDQNLFFMILQPFAPKPVDEKD